MFITFEGIDGCGKTTQLTRLQTWFEAQYPTRELVVVREPGATKISEAIRALILSPSSSAMVSECELLLYEASRAQLVREVIQPALEREAIVLSDRFYDSTSAYQAGARGLSTQLVDRANELGSCGITPNLTLFFDIDPAQSYARLQPENYDRLEQEGLSFQTKVRAGYQALAQRFPQRFCTISAEQSIDAIANEVIACVVRALAAEKVSCKEAPSDLLACDQALSCTMSLHDHTPQTPHTHHE